MMMFTTAKAAATTRNDFYDGNDEAKNTEKERMINSDLFLSHRSIAAFLCLSIPDSSSAYCIQRCSGIVKLYGLWLYKTTEFRYLFDARTLTL